MKLWKSREERKGWYRSWSLGRLEFEIEWVPRGYYYTFGLTLRTPDDKMREFEG